MSQAPLLISCHVKWCFSPFSPASSSRSGKRGREKSIKCQKFERGSQGIFVSFSDFSGGGGAMLIFDFHKSFKLLIDFTPIHDMEKEKVSLPQYFQRFVRFRFVRKLLHSQSFPPYLRRRVLMRYRLQRLISVSFALIRTQTALSLLREKFETDCSLRALLSKPPTRFLANFPQIWFPRKREKSNFLIVFGERRANDKERRKKEHNKGMKMYHIKRKLHFIVTLLLCRILTLSHICLSEVSSWKHLAFSETHNHEN